MSYQQRFTCDVCGAERGPSNHWFLGYTEDSPCWVRYMTWKENEATDPGAIHLCGESCAATHLTRVLSAQKEGTA